MSNRHSKSYKPIPTSQHNFNNNPNRDIRLLEEQIYYRMLSELSITRFKWEGLPNTVSERFIEKSLFNSGLCVFFDHKTFGRLALRATPMGYPNWYDDPTSFTVYGNSFINETVLSKDCVPIWANTLRTSEVDIVQVFANRLTVFDRTIDIKTRQARTPYIVNADENERLSFVNALRQQDEGQPIIFATRSFDPNKITFFPTEGHPDTILNLQVAKAKVWNEAMTFLGINNANQDKRERLVSDEVSANNDQVDSTRSVALKSRREGARLINEKYGLNVSVNWAESDTGMTLDYLSQSATGSTGRID